MQDGDKHPDTTLPSFVKRAVVAQGIVIIVLVWGYATWRIRTDEAEVLDNARHELGAVAAGMYVHMQAVLNDSLGAARAGANSIISHGGLNAIGPAQATDLLSRELSSGDYVRALFVASEGRYLSVSRDDQVQSLDTWPQWFDLAAQRPRNVYIGPHIPDPIESSQQRRRSRKLSSWRARQRSINAIRAVQKSVRDAEREIDSCNEKLARKRVKPEGLCMTGV